MFLLVFSISRVIGMEVYEKSYKGLVLWLLGYTAALVLCMFAPFEDEGLLVRLSLNVTWCAIAVLCWMMVRNERIYWINGVTFEQAKRATSDQRREFAEKHFRKFGKCALICLAFSAVGQLIGLHFVFDILVETIYLIVVAISTIKIKLE